MNKPEIIKCIHTSMRKIEGGLSDAEHKYLMEEIVYERLNPVEMVVKMINEPGVKYHEALKMANDYIAKYSETVARLKIRFKNGG